MYANVCQELEILRGLRELGRKQLLVKQDVTVDRTNGIAYIEKRNTSNPAPHFDGTHSAPWSVLSLLLLAKIILDDAVANLCRQGSSSTVAFLSAFPSALASSWMKFKPAGTCTKPSSPATIIIR